MDLYLLINNDIIYKIRLLKYYLEINQSKHY